MCRELCLDGIACFLGSGWMKHLVDVHFLIVDFVATDAVRQEGQE